MRKDQIALCVFLLSSTSAHALTLEEGQVIVEQVNTGNFSGGVEQFELKPDFAKKMKQSGLLNVYENNGRQLVSVDQDRDYQKCLSDSGMSFFKRGGQLTLSLVSVGTSSVRLKAGSTILRDGIGLSDFVNAEQCNVKFHQKLAELARLHKFDLHEITIREGDQKVRDYVDLIVDATDANVAIIQKGLDQVRLDLNNTQELNDEIKKNVTEIKENTKKIVDYIKYVQQQENEAKRIASAHDDVKAAVGSITIIASLAFRNNPELSTKISNGAQNLGSIAHSVIDIAMTKNLSSMQKIVASGNIVNAALGLVSLFGSGGTDPTIDFMQKNFSAVRADIAELRQEMNNRFDYVDYQLSIIYSEMIAGNNRIVVKLTDIDNKIESMNNRLEPFIQSSIKFYRDLVTLQFKGKVLNCSPTAVPIFDANKIFECASDFSIFSTSAIKTMAVTGAAFYYKGMSDEDADSILDKLSYGDRFGFISQRLAESDYVEALDAQLLKAEVANPEYWLSGTDAYTAILAAGYREPSKFPTNAPLKTISKNISQINISAGTDVIKKAYTLRTIGLDTARREYLAAINSMVSAFYPEFAKSFYKLELYNTVKGPLRKFTTAYIDNGNNFQFSLQRGHALYRLGSAPRDQIIVTDGNEKECLTSGEVAVLEYRTHTANTGQAATQGNVYNWVEHDLPKALCNETSYPLSGYNSGEFIEEEARIAKQKEEYNAEFINNTTISKWDRRVLETVKPSQIEIDGSENLRNACIDVERKYKLLASVASLYRDNLESERSEWLTLLETMPQGGNDPKCKQSISKLLPSRIVNSEDLLEVALQKSLNKSAEGLAEKFMNSYLKDPDLNQVKFVQDKLKVLSACMIQDMKICR